MDGNNKIDELLIAYLLGEADAGGEQLVHDWINSGEGNQQYLDKLAGMLSLVSARHSTQNIIVGEEWMRFKQNISAGEMPEEAENEMAVTEERPVKIRTFYKILAVTAIAASVLLAVGLRWDMFEADMPAPEEVAIKRQKEKTDSLLHQTYLTRRETNTTGKLKKLILRDGSEILLSDKSEVSFTEPFAGNKRDIYLTGRANFKVAKDKTKPFTVYSGAIATTALGTRFTVEAFKNADFISVKLYEGKVVVRSADGSRSALKDAVYLLPGQKLIYDPNRSMAKLEKFHLDPSYKNEQSMDEAYQPNDNPSIPKKSKGSWYMFNNQSLAKVFDQLEDMYNVKITYSKKDVARLYFIGTFNKSDSLENVLHQIAVLNNLKVLKVNNTFVIRK
jgi:transmembrane sensor